MQHTAWHRNQIMFLIDFLLVDYKKDNWLVKTADIFQFILIFLLRVWRIFSRYGMEMQVCIAKQT